VLMSVDDVVRQLVQALDDTGRLSNTLFVFMSDNGLMAGEHHLNPWKNLPYRWSTAIPMTIRWDGHLPANRTDRRLALNLDVATTIADVAWASMSTDGLSLLRRQTRSGFPLEGCAWHRFDSLPRHPAYCGWRTKNWMYTQYATGEQELYHYRDDRHELHDLSDHPAHRARLKEMRAEAKAACKPVPPDFSWFGAGK
jgi:N-acetylglucosamine-6-sulfatase